MSECAAASRTITVPILARVEGEGGLTIRLKGGQVEDVALRIFEPPRFFEPLLRGRSALEVPDITSRICGICSVAYEMSGVHAIEKIYGVTMPPELRLLRRLFYCGEWIESHALHIFLLHAPDFLGFDSAVAMAQASPQLAEPVRLPDAEAALQAERVIRNYDFCISCATHFLKFKVERGADRRRT
jgi:coenzyme F420-reducing hydrogenase alpha subunit